MPAGPLDLLSLAAESPGGRELLELELISLLLEAHKLRARARMADETDLGGVLSGSFLAAAANLEDMAVAVADALGDEDPMARVRARLAVLRRARMGVVPVPDP